MKKILKIGLVIADPMEYEPIKKYAEMYGGEDFKFYGKTGHKINLKKADRTIEVYSVLCGIGLVNAAAATAFLAYNNVDMVINTGLSGGISGVLRGEVAMATRMLEHDFDLSPLGYEKGVIPDQNYVYEADKLLLEHFISVFPEIKAGTMVSGNCFVCDDQLRESLKVGWNAIACDMESSAVAAVAELSGVRMAAIRRISDDAGANSVDTYREMNELKEEKLLDVVFKGIEKMFENESFWDIRR